ncbi:glutamate--cysteine ligase [Methylomarinovum caldicuralii]|uniref:Glutamate--cysteine ligase n=1 Tax=Methylomarinovum caldicuralii TaxID=438856 RepID=A0AAU9CM26_9GAMM|nr:glutamate--cysteine ligase [Methylomarinovum caldicuralii]BCX80502.1 glutamate--cysteine ligase [Methylomarinovum caldicuralii]
MNTHRFQQRLASLATLPLPLSPVLGLKGLEKESLRVTRDGRIARTPHPQALGSALTHPHITTDYSEALLEFITPPAELPETGLGFLDEIHRFVYAVLPQDELLLCTSMPIGFERDEDIPIARYGDSNIGRMKHIYRVGLAYRYGRAMQAIAGIHFNYSLPTALWPALSPLLELGPASRASQAAAYFALIRNVLRYGWLLLYLFGASPAVDRRFLTCRGGIPQGFEELTPDTFAPPFATSLRMSDIGYKNKTQAALFISTNTLDEYVRSLCHAIETPHPPYQAIGVKVGDRYRQLNANILQIENEYYSPIRPKQIARPYEKPTLALKRRGVRYVELRALDLDPFEPLGIGVGQMRFLELFLWFCLLQDSPPLDREEHQCCQHNLLLTAQRGRDPQLRLRDDGGEIPLRQWAERILACLEPLSRLFDEQGGAGAYGQALADQQRKVADAAHTPSARMIAEMTSRSEPFTAFALRLSQAHADHFRQRPLPEERRRWFEQQAQRSWADQHRLEQEDRLSFEEFLRRYFSETCQAA